MNYAAMLAVVVILTFFFPLSVRLARENGVPGSLITIVLAALAVFGLAFWFVRWQVSLHRDRLDRLAMLRAQVAGDPENPRAYFLGDEHLAALLLRLGRRREAGEVIDRYARLGGARETEISALRESLAAQTRRTRRVT